MHNAFCETDNYFQQKKTNCASAIGFLPLKTTTIMHMLSFDTPTKAQEEYCRMAPNTAQESMLRWCRGI